MSDFASIWQQGINWCQSKGYDVTATFMLFSDKGNGAPLTFNNSSSVSSKVKTSNVYKQMIARWINQFKISGKRTFSDGLEFMPDDVMDLYLSLQHVDIAAKKKKQRLISEIGLSL